MSSMWGKNIMGPCSKSSAYQCFCLYQSGSDVISTVAIVDSIRSVLIYRETSFENTILDDGDSTLFSAVVWNSDVPAALRLYVAGCGNVPAGSIAFHDFIGPIPWDHSGHLCHALSLSLSSSWTSMRRRRTTQHYRHLVNGNAACGGSLWRMGPTFFKCFLLLLLIIIVIIHIIISCCPYKKNSGYAMRLTDVCW